jgi:hypothetical protein
LGWKGETQKAAVRKILKFPIDKYEGLEISRDNAFRAIWRLQAIHFARKFLASETDEISEHLPAIKYVAKKGLENLTSDQIGAFIKGVYLTTQVEEEKAPLSPSTEEGGKKKQKTITEAFASMKPLD